MNTTTSETYDIAEVNASGLLPGFMQEFFGKNQYMTIAVPITLLLAILILVVLNMTTFGYELKATGHNKDAAKYAGMNSKLNIILTLLISGAISGLAASLYYLTSIEHYKISSSVPGMGFSGIAVAFLGGLNPIGAIAAGLFVEYITLGGQYLNTNYYNPQVADLMIAIIIYLCGFVLFFKTILNRPGKVKVNANAEPAKPADKAEEKEV
jgi:simple sugar transport system permease protein